MKNETTGQPFRQRISLGDKFYMALHEISHTMIYLADFQVKGALSVEDHLAASIATFRRFPILKSVVKGKQGWFERFQWEETDTDGSDLWEFIDCYRDGAVPPEESARLYRQAFEKCSNTSWDIKREPPMKTKLVRRGEDRWNLFFMIHHAVADAYGTTAIIEVFAENYTLVSQGKTPPVEPIPQVKRSMLKFLFSIPPWKLLATLWTYLRYERMNRPRTNTPFLTDWKQREGTIRAVDLILQKPITRQILRRVRELGISLNEAMILACARSLYKFIKEQGRSPGKISISVPVNLRPYLKLGYRETVGNCSVAMNVNFRAALMDNAVQLIRALRFQSRALKKSRLPLIGILQAGLISWLPLRILKKMFAQSIESGQAARSTATMVYSNVGMVFTDEKGEPFLIPVGPEAAVEMLRVSIPIAYPVASSMATITYGGKILVSLSYLEPVLDQEAMKEFLKRFRSELFAVMDETDLMTDRLPPFSETLKQIEGAQGEMFTHDTFS
jgi:NRPS condensation-like uncharacterized protein